MTARLSLLPLWLRRRSAAHLRAGVAWLVLALCLSGWLGQMHSFAHAPALSGRAAVAQGAAGLNPELSAAAAQQVHARAARNGQMAHVAHVAHVAHDRRGSSWIDFLFEVHSAVECRLYDQLTGELPLPGAALVVLPLALPQAQLRTQAGEFIARWVALFDARGPPRAASLSLL